MSSNYKSIDKFGINVQEKLYVLKNVKALRKDMISMRINIEKKYRIILDQMILKTSYISDDVNEANGICSLRNKIEKINTSIAKLKSINLDVTLLAEFGALPEKWYYKLSRDVEGVRRYLMSWQKYWVNEIPHQIYRSIQTRHAFMPAKRLQHGTSSSCYFIISRDRTAA